jgi:peptidoglycan/LPS O-acetylase OafA/YrhL
MTASDKDALAFVAAAAVAIAVAAVSYRVVERPFLRRQRQSPLSAAPARDQRPAGEAAPHLR